MGKKLNIFTNKLRNNYGRGFIIPPNYFQNIEDAVFTKITEDTIPKKTGYKVPTAYFENLEKEIISKIGFSKKIKKLLYFAVSFTTSAAAIIILYFGIYRYNKTATPTFDSLTYADINNWIEQENNYFDSYIIENISKNTSSELNSLFESVSEQDLDYYINNTDSYFLFP